MRFTRSVLLGAAAVALSASSSFAQTSAASVAPLSNGLYLHLEGGLSHPFDMNGSAAAGIPSGEAHRQDGAIFGGAVGYELGPWRSELDLDYSRNDMGSGTNVFVDGGSTGLRGHSSNFSFMANFYYDIATGTHWTPYIGFGIGGTELTLDHVRTTGGTAITNSSDLEFAYQPIVGISYKINNHWSANADYRYFASTNATLPYAPGGKFSVSNSSNNFLLGVTYHFSAPPPPPPPAAAPAPAAAPVKAEAPAVPPPPAKRTFLVFFEFNRASLTPAGQKVVNAAAAAYRQGKPATVSVAGYTDLVGTQAYNLRLSKRRANTVRAALVKDGVPANEISVAAYGKEHPLVPTANGVRNPQNRRVEIVF